MPHSYTKIIIHLTVVHVKAAASEISGQTGGKLDFLIINGAMFVHERSSLTIDSLWV